MTQLIEFQNHKEETLRGILDEVQSDHALVFVHGFERTTLESKFKNIVDAMRGKTNLLRFDFSGCGLSDGSFEDLTVEKLSNELICAIAALQKECPQAQKISFVGFSLGCCIITRYLSRNKTKAEKLAFFAPGFNQRQLLRYFFTRQQHRDKVISWENYNTYANEEAFQSDILRPQRMMKEHYISDGYFKENAEMDYQDEFISLGYDASRVMILQGSADDKVPAASNETVCGKYQPLFVQDGDHDLQRPDMVEQYLSQLIAFLT